MSKMIISKFGVTSCVLSAYWQAQLRKSHLSFKHASNVELVWKSFQLDPTIPTENITKSHYEFLAEKKGWTVSPNCKELHKSLLVTGKKAGIDFNFDIVRDTNSFNTHHVFQLAQEKGLGNDAEEIFFKAFFQDGKNLNDRSEPSVSPKRSVSLRPRLKRLWPTTNMLPLSRLISEKLQDMVCRVYHFLYLIKSMPSLVLRNPFPFWEHWKSHILSGKMRIPRTISSQSVMVPHALQMVFANKKKLSIGVNLVIVSL